MKIIKFIFSNEKKNVLYIIKDSGVGATPAKLTR